MSSGVPQNFDATFVAKVEKLIARARAIGDYVDPYSEYACNEDAVLRDLSDWMDEVDAAFGTNELKKLLPLQFYLPRKMRAPRLPMGKVLAFGDTEFAQRSMAFRKELLERINSQINALTEVKGSYKKLLEPIIIHIDKDGLIWREDRDKYSIKFKSKSSKRVRLIIMLSKFTRHVETSKIMKQLSYDTLQTLSKEKGWINKHLQEQLDLPGELIEGGGKIAHVGYRINPIFVIKVEK